MNHEASKVLVASDDLAADILGDPIDASGGDAIRCFSPADTIAQLVEHGDQIGLAFIGVSPMWEGLREFLCDAFPQICPISITA